jgi:hypothetical protein
MIFEKRREERHRRKKKENRRRWAERIHKFIFFAGLGIALKGLKAWLGSKRKNMRH